MTRQHPRRTVAVVLLDLATTPLTALRGLVRAARGPLRRRTVGGTVVAAVAMLAGAATLVVVLLPGRHPATPSAAQPVRAPDRTSTPHPDTPGLDAGAASPVSLAMPNSPRSTTATARPSPRLDSAPVPLTARYATVDSTLFSYRASVVITNPGPTPVTGWTLVITLPRRTLSVTDVTGAEARQSDATWTFVPEPGSGPMAAGGSVEVRFRVNGGLLGSAPTACTIDGRPCEVARR